MKVNLRRLARMCGIAAAYRNASGDVVKISPETLSRMIAVVTGRNAEDPLPTEEIEREASRSIHRALSPVLVTHVGENLAFWLNFGEGEGLHGLRLEVVLEDTSVIAADLTEPIAVRRRPRQPGCRRGRFQTGFALPLGYHRLRVFRGETLLGESLVLSAPAPGAPRNVVDGGGRWGLFAPLYAAVLDRGSIIGDLRALAQLQDEVHAQDGGFVGTTPLLALDDARDPSPYSPLSRLFWNEIYLDVESLAAGSPVATAAWVATADERRELSTLANLDYVRIRAVKEKVLRILSHEFFENGKNTQASFLDFLRECPRAQGYARDRAGGDAETEKYHLYVQFEMFRALSQRARLAKSGQSAALYLDFPVGVHPDGFDAREFADSFLKGATVGAPPDLFFAHGQNWGFHPFHPRMREEGYAYLREALRAHLRFAGLLRLDHVMGFLRIYAIPNGVPADRGAYLRYHADELFAIIAIEAERAGALVIGEDLGTVPDEIRAQMRASNCLGMWVLPFEAGEDPVAAFARISEDRLACLNTHDMVPLAGYLGGVDIDRAQKIGFLSDAEARDRRRQREDQLRAWKKSLGAQRTGDLLTACLQGLACSAAPFILVNAEDLLLETEAQNLPGTGPEQPNWRRRLRKPVRDWLWDPEVRSRLAILNDPTRDPVFERSQFAGLSDPEQARFTVEVRS